MPNQLVPFEGGQAPALASQVKSGLLDAAQSNLSTGFAVVGYRGKNWRIRYQGEETLVEDDRGPVNFLEAVIVGVSPNISKIYYGSKYVEGADEQPDCFSVDGQAPDASVQHPQCATCAACANNVWGSRITEAGKKGKACQDSRRLAIVPLGDLEGEEWGGPMLLRVPPMSLLNLAQYAKTLGKKGASFEFVATRLGFDHEKAYPQITFAPLRWLTDEEARVIVGQTMKDPVIERILGEASEIETQPAADDPLAGGGPSQVFSAELRHPTAPIPPNHVPASPPPSVTVAQPPVVPPAAATPPKRNGFAASKPAAEAPAATPKPVKLPTVEEAPADLQSAIDELMNAPLA